MVESRPDVKVPLVAGVAKRLDVLKFIARMAILAVEASMGCLQSEIRMLESNRLPAIGSMALIALPTHLRLQPMRGILNPVHMAINALPAISLKLAIRVALTTG